MCTRSSYPSALYLLNIRDCLAFTVEDDVAAKPDLHRSLPKEDHMLQGRMIASKEFIFGSNVDATAMYDFVPTTKLKGNEEFVEETEFYDRYESIDASSAVPIDVLPEKHLVFPALLNAYGG